MTRVPHPAPLAPLRKRSIGIIGAGTMGQALIRGLLTRGLRPGALRVAEPDAGKRQQVVRRFKVRAAADGARVARASDVIILAVKPQQFPGMMAVLAPHLTRRHLVISIAAGITLRWLQRRLPGVPVMRVMPNLPATVGCGFAALTAGRAATAAHRRIARAIFEAVGETVELPERQFDAITAVSGSGPAYVLSFVQAWTEAARGLGLPSGIASRAVRQTLEGVVRLLAADRETPEALIAKVASKGGTTEAALKVLATRRVSAGFVAALRAAARRSRELSR